MTRHPGWCAADHRCNLAEHRSTEIVVDLPGHGRAVLTRVRNADGQEHAEIRLRVVLGDTEDVARHQLRVVLTDLRTFVTRAAHARVAARPGRRRAA